MLVIFGDRIQYHKDTYFRVPACKEDKWQKEGQGLKFSIKKKKRVLVELGVSQPSDASISRHRHEWGVSPM